MTTKPTPELLNEGADAYGRGDSVFRCPYPEGTAEAEGWVTGWTQALARDEDSYDPLGVAG
jgi:hypothetical protein